MVRHRLRIWACAAALGFLTACTAAEGFFFLRSAGADMPVWIRGNTAANRMLLILHGGPGHNALSLSSKEAFRLLEQDMAVAYWDQRASGSSRGEATPASLNLDQFVADLDGVVDGLRQKYPDSRIVLLGHSWGGTLGPAYLADAGRQAKIAAWIEVDGAHSVVDGNRLSIETMRARTAARVEGTQGDSRWQAARDFYRDLATMTVAHFPRHLSYVSAMERDLSPDPGTPLPAVLALNLFTPFNGLATTAQSGYVAERMVLQPAFLALHLTPQLERITLPSLVLWGAHDCRLPVSMAKDAYDALGTAPGRKSWKVFDRSAHSPFLNEPAAFVESVRAFVATL